MDLAKKRKADDNGAAYPVPTDFNANPSPVLSGYLAPEDIGKILEPFTKEQLLPIIRAAVLRHPDVLEAVRAVADSDPAQRKLFVRGLGWETTTEKLRQVFSAYGELDESNTIVITDKVTGKSKGYGFVTFKHIDGSILSLKEPNKKIDGRITVTQLAAAGNSANSQSSDVASRKIYVGNIPFEISSERLLSHFAMYGEIEEGPLGFDKQTGKARGFAFFVYKSEEGAQASLSDPMKVLDGHQLICKLATDNKKQRPNMGPGGGMGQGMPNAGGPMGMPDQYGGGGNAQSNYNMGYMGYGQGPNMPHQQQPVHQNTGYNAPMAGPGGPSGPGYNTGYGGGAAPQYGGGGGTGPGDYGGGGYRAMGTQGGYPDSGNYGPPASYPSQPNQPGAGPGPRIPAYQGGVPPYY